MCDVQYLKLNNSLTPIAVPKTKCSEAFQIAPRFATRQGSLAGFCVGPYDATEVNEVVGGVIDSVDFPWVVH
jgi:hypothetical protein